MPVTFKNKSNGEGSTKTIAYVQKQVREALNLSSSTTVNVGFSETILSENNVRVHLPFGIAHVKNGSYLLEASMKRLQSIAGIPAPAGFATAPQGQPTASYSDMTDEQWVEHIAKELFPGTIHLHNATELYQPVIGTSGGSVYKTCFIGPDLKVAARIKGNQVSFRATDSSNECPKGSVRDTLTRLGISSTYPDRMTGHAHMNGQYTEEHAHEYRALFGAAYAALKPWVTSNFPAIGKLTQGVK